MVCCLLSEWCVVTSFYQNSANYVSFPFCETYSTLSAELQHLENSISTQSLPQVDYLKKSYDFFIQHNLYHLSDIDFSDCVKSIPFYDLKHFFQEVIAGIYVEDGKIIAIAFRTEQENDTLHQF